MNELDYSKEVWRSVVGYEGLYSVSDMGRVRRDTKTTHGEAGFILKQHPDAKGYFRVRLYGFEKTDRQFHRVHRLVMRVFVGDCPKGYEVNHINGIKTDNRLENLEYVTPQQNTRHKFDVLGYTNPVGEQNSRAILTEQQVREIRALYAERKLFLREIAQLYGVKLGAVSSIVYGHTWKHVK